MIKDPSNERIKEAVEELSKVMEQEGRGFIFAPICQMEGDHRTMGVVAFTSTTPQEERVKNFWATLASLVENYQHTLPEDKIEEYAWCAKAFLRMIRERCFPTWGEW